MNESSQAVITAYRSPYLRPWIIVTILGTWLAWLLRSYGTEWIVLLIPGLDYDSFRLIVLINYSLSGMGMGICQWFLLRRYFSDAHEWIVAFVLGRAFGGLLQVTIGGASDVLYLVLMLGLFQYLFFKRRKIEVARDWIFAVMIATVISRLSFVFLDGIISFVEAWLFARAELFDLFAGYFTTAVHGAVYGSITGIWLVRFIEQTKARESKYNDAL